jgi:hypothetical protein
MTTSDSSAVSTAIGVFSTSRTFLNSVSPFYFVGFPFYVT